MNVVLISTSDAVSGRSDSLDRMLKSVANTATRRPDIPITVLLLLQQCSGMTPALQRLPRFVDVSTVPHRMSLSAARNVLLSRARSCGFISPSSVIGFPDDDCWYPRGTLEFIADRFEASPGLDLWFCRYGSRPFEPEQIRVAGKPAQARHVIRNASSNTMFFRGSIIQSGLAFDERLGLGTPAGSAEDTEFALRAFLRSREAVYLDAVAVGHRDKYPELRAKYYQGALVAIATHARQQGGVVTELLRKVAVGGWLTLRGELSLDKYLGALADGFNAWRLGTDRRYEAQGPVR